MVTYEFYISAYHGASIAAGDWPMYEARAAEKLAQYKRLYTVTAPDENAEDMAVCAMADALAYFANGAISSAHIGSVSVSYGSAVDLSPKGQARELYRAATMYLTIYRGVG